MVQSELDKGKLGGLIAVTKSTDKRHLCVLFQLPFFFDVVEEFVKMSFVCVGVSFQLLTYLFEVVEEFDK